MHIGVCWGGWYAHKERCHSNPSSDTESEKQGCLFNLVTKSWPIPSSIASRCFRKKNDGDKGGVFAAVVLINFQAVRIPKPVSNFALLDVVVQHIFVDAVFPSNVLQLRIVM